MSINKIKKIAKKYANVLLTNNINFINIYIFGSHAKKKAHKNSDIDLAIVINKLQKNESKIDKQILLQKLALDIDTKIEPIILEKKDFKKGHTSIMADQIEKNGILIEN